MIRESSSTAIPSATESATGVSAGKNNVGLIVGVTVVAVAIVAILAVIAVFVRRRKRRSAYVLQPDQTDDADPYQDEAVAPPPVVHPFTSTAPTSSFSSLKSSVQAPSFDPPTEIPSSSIPLYPPEKHGVTMSHTLSNPSTSSRSPLSPTTTSSRTAASFANFGERMTPNTTGSSEVIQLRPLPRPPMGPHGGVEADTDDPQAADIPVLIHKLNRALAKLPPGGSDPFGEAELPPEYHER